VPFVLSAGLVFLGLWIRHGLDETPDFKKAKETGNVAKMPLVETLRDHWREVLIAAGLKVVETAPFYIFSTFVVSYAVNTLAYTKVSALNAVMIGAAVASLMIPLMGWLSDKIGRKTVYIIGILSIAAFIVPYFMLLDTKTTWGLTIATVVALGILWAPVTAVLGTMSSEIFSTRVRYTGITLGYQLGAALAGGTAPLIATYLLSRYDGSWTPVALYMMGTVLVSLVAVLAVKGTKADLAQAGARRAV
jgi:MFS family permease